MIQLRGVSKSFESMYETLEGCDALVVCTEWSEFRHPDFNEIAARLASKVIFDGRNIYKRRQMGELGFTYYSVGRPPVLQGRQAGANAPVNPAS